MKTRAKKRPERVGELVERRAFPVAERSRVDGDAVRLDPVAADAEPFRGLQNLRDGGARLERPREDRVEPRPA